MLIDFLRDNFAVFLEGEPRKKGHRQTNAYDTVATQSCSSERLSSFGSYESIEVQWQSPVVGKRTKRILTSLADPDSDEAGLPKLTTKGSQNLPKSSWYFSSNHIMVNVERKKKNVHPLTRKHELDAVARWHAENMAEQNRLHHAIPEALQKKVGRPCRVIGKNVSKGESVRAIHNKMMQSRSDVRNMLDPRYVQYGMGTARASDGELFLCQVFIG